MQVLLILLRTQKGGRKEEVKEIMANLREYHVDDDWTQYVERLEFHFVAHDITDAAKKKATLLSVCGAETYKLMCDLLAPLKPKDKTFQELKDLVQKHLKPKPSVMVQRYKFNTRVQNSGEGVACFVAGLRHIAQDCNYGDALLDMLRDRLVCGVASERVQRRLLAEPNLTFDIAFATATAMEAADKNASDLQTTRSRDMGDNSDTPSNMAPAENVNKIREKKFECWFCDKPGHKEEDCRFKKKLEQNMKKEKKKSKGGVSGSDSDLVHSVNFAVVFADDCLAFF